MTSISLSQITVDLPIFGAQNMNLKGKIARGLRRLKSDVPTIRALENVSVVFNEGERIGIIGPNGAGKTTLLRVAAGILSPTAGHVEIEGSVVSMIDQSLGLDNQCTGLENIYRRGIYLNQSKSKMRSIADEIIEFSGLGDRIYHPIHSYSAGMRARLSFSISTSIKPDILIVDEGIGVADDEFTKRASSRLNEFIGQTGILLLATHSKQLVDRYCNKTINILNGRIS